MRQSREEEDPVLNPLLDGDHVSSSQSVVIISVATTGPPVIIAVATGRPTRNITIRKIGNSEGLILPKELLDRLNLKAGDNVIVVQEGQELRLRRLEDSAEEFERKMKIARERMKKYEVAYRALAK